MALVIHGLILAIVMPICCIGPGLFLLQFMRKARWTRSEELCISIGLSVFVVYLCGAAIHLLGADRRWVWLTTSLFAFLTALSWRDLRDLLGSRHVRRQIAGFGFIIMLGLVILSLIRHLSGGDWVSDWMGHYERTLIFLGAGPISPAVFVMEPLPARPPLMNVAAAYFLAHVGKGFESFQLVFCTLNLLAYFSCVLLAGMLVKFGGRRIATITIFLALSPVYLQNAVWSWTRLLTSFYVILAIAFYLRAWRKNDSTRMIAASVSMAAAILTHYSAGPYAIAMAIHYLIILPKRRDKAFEIVSSSLSGAAVLATWFVWSLMVYGTKLTLGSNSTVLDVQRLSGTEKLLQIFNNSMATLIPRPLWIASNYFLADFYQPNLLGQIRDFFFFIYQTSLPTACGISGWIGISWLLRHIETLPGRRIFWAIVAATSIIVGIAVAGDEARYGVAHICLLPLVLIGTTFLGAGFPLLPKWFRYLLVAGLLCDASAGILLQTRIQMQSIRMVVTEGQPVVPITDHLPSLWAVQNATLQDNLGISLLGEHMFPLRWLLYGLLVLMLAIALFSAARWAAGKRSPTAFAGAVAMLLCLLGLAVAPDSPVRREGTTQGSSALTKDRYESGLAHYRKGQLDPAAANLIDAFLLNPNDLQTRYVLNVLLVTHGLHLADTDAALAERVRIAPDDPDAQLALKYKLQQRGYR